MELKALVAVLLISGCVCSALGNAIETTHTIKHQMGTYVTVPCKFTTSIPTDWMFMRWKRESEDGEPINLASIQNNIFSADWSPTAPEDFKDHVNIEYKKFDNGYGLNLVIDGFICSDIGVYTCEVFTLSSTQPLSSTSTLEIEVHPGMPTIHENVLEVKENDSFKIECAANVGLPPQTITWAYTLKEASHIYQKVMEGISQENTPGPDCTTQGKSVLTVEMTEQLDMATFLCATSSELAEDGSPKNYDEVTVQIYGKTTTTTSTLAPSTANVKETVDTSGTSTIPSSVCAIIFSCLVTVYALFTRTT